MDIQAKFKSGYKTTTALSAAQLFGVDLIDLHDRCTDETTVHLYADDSFYIIELSPNHFYTIVERSEFTGTTLAELERAAYIPALVLLDYAGFNHSDYNPSLAMLDSEYLSFCNLFEYPLLNADELACEIDSDTYPTTNGVNKHWQGVYLRNYMERYEAATELLVDIDK